MPSLIHKFLLFSGGGARLGAELVANGGFDTDTNWAKDTDWTISGGTANKVAGADSRNITQTILTVGVTYELTYTLSNYVAGGLTPILGVGTNLTTRTANGTYTQIGVCAGNTTLYFQGNAAFIGSIDNVSCRRVL